MNRDPDEIIAAWLEAGPSKIPEAPLQAVLVAVQSRPHAVRFSRRPAIFVGDRRREMAILATVSIAVILAGTALLGLGEPRAGIGGPPSPRFPTSPSPTGAPSLDDLESHISATIGPIQTPNSIGVGFGSVWVTTHTGGGLIRIDPATYSTTWIALESVQVGNVLVFTSDSVWVGRGPGAYAEQVRLDPKTNRVTAVVPVSGRAAFGGGYVWTYNGQVLTQIDAATARVVDQVRVTDPDPETGVAFGRGSVWVATSQHGLFRVDPVSKKVLAQIDVSAWKVASDGTEVWTVEEGRGVSRIDTIRNRVAATVDIAGAVFPVVANGLVWVTGDQGLTVLDATTAVITDELATGQTNYVGVGFGSVWVPKFHLNEVWRVDWPVSH